MGILYDIIALVAGMTTFLSFLVALSVGFGDNTRYPTLGRVRHAFRVKPLSSGLCAVNFLMFLLVTITLFFPVQLTTFFLIRVIIVRTIGVSVSLLIIWMLAEVENSKSELKGE